MPAMTAFWRLPDLNSASCLAMYSGCCACRMGLAGRPRVPSAVWQARQVAASAWPLAASGTKAGALVSASAGPASKAARATARVSCMRIRKAFNEERLEPGKAADFTMHHDTRLAGLRQRPGKRRQSCAGVDPQRPLSHHREPARPAAGQRTARDRFRGRSNAGKSTAINRLAQQKRLAFASRTPGRTQHINLFEVGPKDAPDALFADLPGYGYAAVERAAKLRWQEVMADYLQSRRSLHGVVLMIDSRLGFTDLDRRLLELLAPRLGGGQVRLLALLTKADKLNRRDAQAALQAAQALLGEVAPEGADIGVTLFSALSRQGLADVAEVLHGWALPS